jgi:hypothetical protein
MNYFITTRNEWQNIYGRYSKWISNDTTGIFSKFIRANYEKLLEEISKERPTFSHLAEMIEKYIESLVSIDYLNMNFSSKNGAVKELLDPTPMNRLDIVNILNETSRDVSIKRREPRRVKNSSLQ